MNEEEKKAIGYKKKQIKIVKKGLEEGKYYGERYHYAEDIKHTEILLNLIEKQDKIINEYETECRQLIAFCRKIRKDYKHDVDNFNQGQEYKCVQFLSLLDGEKNWTYEGKYFDEHDRQIEELEKVGE